MSNADNSGQTDKLTMTDELSNEDIGHLLTAKAEKLISGEDDPDAVLRDILETLGRSETIRTREKVVDMNGRVSIGRDLSGEYGLTLFQSDPSEGDDDE